MAREMRECRVCGGQGFGVNPGPCPVCDGEGKVPVTFLGPNGGVFTREGYVRYLRECAQRWRCQPGPTAASKLANEAQAQRVEAQADAIEKGAES